MGEGTAPGWPAPALRVEAAARPGGGAGAATAAIAAASRRGGRDLHLDRLDAAGDADAQIALLDLDLGEIGLGDELGELAHELRIEGVVLGHRLLGHRLGRLQVRR